MMYYRLMAYVSRTSEPIFKNFVLSDCPFFSTVLLLTSQICLYCLVLRISSVLAFQLSTCKVIQCWPEIQEKLLKKGDKLYGSCGDGGH